MTSERPSDPGKSERGKPATTEQTGEVHGSGSGIGNPGSGEDYADDLSTGSGADRRPSVPGNGA